MSLVRMFKGPHIIYSMYQLCCHIWIIHILVIDFLIIARGPIVETFLVAVIAVNCQGYQVVDVIVCCFLIVICFDHALSSGDIVIASFRIFVSLNRS